MQSSQVRNVGLPSCADTKRDVPAWTQDPKIFPLDWFSISRPNIIRQTKEYVSELSKWRNCPKIKTLSKLKAVLKRIMMFLHTHISYIDGGKSLLECDLEEDLITLVSLYMDMELRVILIKKSAASGATTSNGPGTDTDSARNDKLVSDRISYWLYTLLTGHEQRVDALLSTTVYTRHTRPVLDPIFRKVLSEMPDGPFSNVSYVRNMLAYKTWRERTLVTDDVVSEELNIRILQQLVPRDYAFPSPLLRCLGKGENARDHARPHNVNLADACRNFMRYCREIPATAAGQINFESIPLLDDEMLGDEENEVINLMNMISSRKQRKTASVSPRNSIQVDAFIDLTLPKSKTKSSSVAAVIDLTEEDEKPVITAPTSVVVEPSATPSRVVSTVQRINASKKPQVTQECSYALTPSATQVETRCFTAYRDQDIYLVNISCMCPVRAHRQRECQCQDKKGDYYKENKALKTSITERKYEKDATFVGRCFQFSIGNQYAYPSEDDVDTEIEPLVVGNSQDQVKLEMRSSTADTCNTNEDTTQDETTEFCDKLFSADLNLCDCDGCKNQDTNLSRYENSSCVSDNTSHGSANELSDNVQCRQKPLVTCSQRMPHPTSVADMYAMENASPIVLQSQQTATLSGNERNLEHFSETLDKRKVHYSDIQNTKIPKDNFVQNTENLSSNCLNEIRKIKLPVVDNIIEDTPDKFEPPVVNEDVYTVGINPITQDISTITCEKSIECEKVVIPHLSEENIYEERTDCEKDITSHCNEDITNNTISSNKNKETTKVLHSNNDISNSTTLTNTEEITKCKEDVTHNTNEENAILTNTNEGSSEPEKVVLLHSNEKNLNVMSSNTDQEIAVSSHLNKEDFTQSTNISTVLSNANMEPQNAVVNDIEVHSESTNITAITTSFDTSTLQEQISFLPNAQNEPLLPKSNSQIEIERLCNEVTQLGCSVTPDIQQPVEKDSNEKCLQNDLMDETSSVSEPTETITAYLEKHSEEISEQLEETDHDVSTENIETTVEEIVEHNEHCVHPMQVSSNSTEFENIVETTEESSAKDELPETGIDIESVSEIRDISIQPSNDNQLENVKSNRSNTELTLDETATITQDLHEDVPQTVTESEIVVKSVPEIHEITIQPSNDSQLENVESNGSNTELTFDETATIKQDLHEDVPQTVIQSEIVVESAPEIHEITIEPSNDSQLENVESNGSNTELSFDETATIKQDLHEDVPQTVIESEIVVASVPEIHEITIQPSNDSQLENVESNGSNTELSFDETVKIKQYLHEDVPQTVIESEIVVASVPEICDITIQPSNDSQLENVESNCSNTELPFDETATTQDLHEDVPQTVILSEIVVESAPEIHEISIQPSNDSQLENVESNGSNTELTFDETPTIKQDLHEDVPQTVIESEIVVESVPEIHEITIQPSNDCQLENVESDSNNTELPFDETATTTQDLHEDVPQTVIQSEIVVESAPEIHEITIEPSNDSQLENVESNGSNTELSFDETATIKQDLNEDVPQTVIESEIVVDSVLEICDITIQPFNDSQLENGSNTNLHEDVPQIVIESKIVVESVPEIRDISIQPSNDNQLENVESNKSNTELSFDETATITQDLHEDVPQTVSITSSDHVEPKEKTSFVVDIQKNEAVVISKNDEGIMLSPRKRRRRKPNLNINNLIDEDKPAEPCDEIVVTNSLNDNVSVNIEERKSLNNCERADNLPEQPESIKSSTKKFEETQDNMSTTCQEISSDNTNLPILSKEIVSYDTKPIDPIIEDTVSVQTSESKRPKRRRKQNLKNIRDEKLTAPVEDNSTVPENQNKELVVVCKNLSQNEIDNLRKNKPQPLSEFVTEERDTANQLSKDISTPNLNIVEASLQPVIFNEIKNETDLNIENNNANIEHPEDTLQSNNKEKPKQRITKIKSRRKSKLVDNISDKIENDVVDRVINSTLVETLPITKLKRPRGRPSKKASRKLDFFSENLKLDSTKNNSTSDIVTTSDKLNTTAQLDLSDEDVPLAYRVSQSTPQKINSLKSSNKIINKLRLSDVENELVNSEDELPLSARKQKTKPTKHPKNISTTKLITKPKTFREKLQKFKFQARDKTEIIDNIKIQEEESDIFTLKKFNIESRPRKAVKTYSNTRALKTPKLFSVPEIIQASTIKPSKSNLNISPVKPKKSLRFASEVSVLTYNAEDVLNPEATRNINESKISNEESKNLNSSLHRAEQIKIKKFREIYDKTDLLSFENPKIANKKDNVSPVDNAIMTQENKNIEISIDLKSSTNNKEIKTKTNFILASKKTLSKKAREKLFPETDKNYKENKSKIIINNTKIEEASFSENISSFEEKNSTLLPKSSSEYKENESSIKIRKNNEHERVNIDQKENSLNSPTKLKTDTPISNNVAEQDNEIITENVPKKQRSKNPKLKLKRSSCSPKKLQNNIDSPPKKVTQFKTKNKIQKRLNGSNNKTKKVTSRRKSNKTESDVNVLQQDVSLNLKCDSKDITPDSIKDFVIDTTIKKEESQNVEITKNISSLSSENESAELTNICAGKVADITDISENIERANISSDMLYKPSNKIYEKNFEFYSDQDDVSNSELVIDTSAESSDAEDKKVENKLEIDDIQNKVSSLNQIKYHHSIAEIINITPVENSTTENKSHISTQDYIKTEPKESANESQKEINSIDEKFDPSVISMSEETVTQEGNSEEKNDVILNPSEEIIEHNTFQESLLSQETSVKHQESNILINNVCDSSSISIVEETVVGDMIVDESLITNEDHNNTIFDKNIDIQNIVEEKPTKIISEEHSAEILEISEEIYNELNIEKIIEEKAQQLSEPYAPSVEMLMNIEIGFESCTLSQDKPLQEEHAKEGCVKCSVNGKHRDNKRVTVQGTHQYEENNVEECLEEHEIIPAITYCQAVEILEPNLCICTAKDVTAQMFTNDSPVVDNYNLCILADIAMSSIHLNTKTENNNVIQITGEGSNNIHTQGPLQKDERCVFVTFPDNAPTSSKPAITISVIGCNDEEMSVNVQKIASGVNSKGSLLENKIQVLTERAKNGNKINGDNLDELYRSLENICELEINTITKTPPKSDCLAAASIPIETPPVNSKITEPNITIDIPNTALLHLTPDDDDFPIRNEPFTLQMPVVKSLETPAVPQIEKVKIDTAVAKNLYNELESITIDQKTPNSENENCESPKEAEQATKTKSKKGRSKSKTSNNQKSEASYLLNKYKSNQDSNTNTNNQQNSNSRKNNNSSPTSYIRSTRPMRMVTTRKRNVNVLDNNCSPDEPKKKISASEKMFDKLLKEHRKELSETKLQNTIEETVVQKNVENIETVSVTTMPVLDDIPETPVISASVINTEESNIPLPVLDYKKQESNFKNEEIEATKPDTSKDIAEKIETVTSVNDQDDGRGQISEEKMVKEIALEIPSNSEKDLVHKETQSEDTEISQPAEITTICSETQIEKNTEEQTKKEEVDRNTSAIEVVQDWLNRVDDNKAQSESASEKMFDKLLKEHRKELSEPKLQNTKEGTVVQKNVENIETFSVTTMPVLDDIPETPVISASVINTEESNIPLPVLDYKKQESNLKNKEIEVTKSDTSYDIAEKIETVASVNDQDDSREKISEEKMVEEIALEIHSNNSEKDLVHKETQSEDTELSQPAEITTICSETQIEKNTEEQIKEEEVDRNTSAIEVVQDWFNRVDDNKAQSESYTDITSIQTIEECNFFEEVSSTSENSPSARRSDEKVFSEHQTPDSGIAFDEDSVQKDKSVPENLSDGETYCPTEPAVTKTYFCNLNQSDGVKQIEISDIKLVKPSKSSEMNKMELKVSIELERIKDILPLLTKYTPERKFKKRKELITETDKTKKRKYSLDETHVNIVSEESSNNTLIIDNKFKRRKHSNDDNTLQECVIEDVMSPDTSQRDMSSNIRTKGSVKEYPDCLFGITESPVPSGSFHSPYPSDISITEEPTFSEECGIDLCNDYPCYDSFEVLQEQQSSQREYSVVDDNPKDVQQGIQAGYCVLDLQCLPISEYMNDGDYILVDNKIVNDKRMVLVNMQQVQPETKPHNPEEVKRSEFDDSEKEDSLSETVEEIIKNPSLFSEQTASEFQVISMDQATSEVQVVIACDNFQETEMTDNYLFGIALQNELSSETPSTSAASDIQPTPMEIDETTPDNKIIEKSVKLPTPKKDEQFNKISAVSQPISMELLTPVNSISKSVGAQHIIEIKQISKDKLTNSNDINESVEKSRKISTRKLSIKEQPQHFYTLRSPTSKLTTQAPSIKSSYKTFQKPCNLKPSTQYEQGISDAKEVNKSKKELEPKTCSLKTPDKSLPTSIKPLFKDQIKFDHQYGAKINSNNTYPDHKPHSSIQKPTKNDPITSHSISSANKKLNDSKVPSKKYSPKMYRPQVSPDAFDRLKEDRTDITPPDSRTRYHSLTKDPNFMKNRNQKETALDYQRRQTFDRRSPRLKQISQSSSDSRRSQSAYTEPSPKPSYRLPPSDPTHRSSQYNNKKPDTKTSQSRMERGHSQSTSSAHKDWLKNETLLNLIKTANTIYSKKY